MVADVMHPILDRLVERFRAAQDLGVATLTATLGIPRPSSGMDWAHYCAENGLHQVGRLQTIGFHAHGDGIELKIGDVTIDFEWGDHGEADGFDAWRLWNFRTENCPEIACTYDDVQRWLDFAFADGRLLKDSRLHDDPRRCAW